MRISVTSAELPARLTYTSVRKRLSSTSPKLKLWIGSWTSLKSTANGSSLRRRNWSLRLRPDYVGAGTAGSFHEILWVEQQTAGVLDTPLCVTVEDEEVDLIIFIDCVNVLGLPKERHAFRTR